MARIGSLGETMKERSWWQRVTVSAFVVACGVYMMGCSCLVFGQSKLVYFPTKEIDWTPARAGLRYEDVTLTAAKGQTINAWYVPCEGARGTVIFAHGNGENISWLFDYVEFYRTLKMNVFLFDYRGYGRSTGKPSEKATYEDVTACWKYLTEERKVPANKIVLSGRSLGGAVVAWLAAREKPAGLVLESTFTSVPDMGAEIFPWLPVRLIARIHYDTKAIIGDIRCPILVAHSPTDDVIPYKHGRKLYELAQAPKRFAELRGDHNCSPWEKGSTYASALDEFLTECLSTN